MNNSITAMILCLGEASRMRPLSLRYPKALLPFCGRPLIEYTLVALLQYGIRNVIVVTGWCDDHLGQVASWGNEHGMYVRVVKRSLEHGSAGVVKDVARELLAGTEDILVIYGDSLISLDLGGILDAHEARKTAGCELTVAFHTPSDLIAPGRPCSNYGILWLDSAQRVVGFIEKPAIEQVTSPYANAGIFVVDQCAFERFSERRPLDFSRDVFEQLANCEDSPIYGFNIGTGYRYDIGTIQDFSEKQFAVLRGEILLEGVPWPLVRITGPLSNSGRVEGRALVGRDCRIQERVSMIGNNVIGSRVAIGAGSTLNNCVVLDDTEIGDSVHMSDTVIGAWCRIADGCVLGRGTLLGDYSMLTSTMNHSS